MKKIIFWTLLFLCFNLYAEKKFVLDDEKIKLMVEKANQNAEIKIEINEKIVEELKKFLGSPARRDDFLNSIRRRDELSSLIALAEKKYGIPKELSAIGIVESSFINFRSAKKNAPAGIWMFMPATARRYAMEVGPKRDERLDVAKLTDAAYHYLQGHYLVFNDWSLAILAYNLGEIGLLKLIQTHRTRDPWELLDKLKKKNDYLPKVMAAIIIMLNKEILAS